MKNILIGGAWPYANGPLHIGHIAGLLPGDILARFHRQVGNKVSYVSGTDCYGTPIALRAASENKSPEEISAHYHTVFCKTFENLGFSYDYYGKTSSTHHNNFVKDFHEKLYSTEHVAEKTELHAFCKSCNKFLPDRFVTGKCPNCQEEAKGDQCDHCGFLFDSKELLKPVCFLCKNDIELRPSTHLYLNLSDFQEKILSNIDEENWRKNAVNFTKHYISEGLRSRALTRDMEWGIEVPKKGYDGKKIYIWAENVLGYLSSCKMHCEKTGEDFNSYWKNKDAFHYYVHGKDNIPFHSIVLPSLLLASGEEYNLPNAIISSEYMTLEGKKISTSLNHAIWADDLIREYAPDAIRYFLIINGPEKRDGDFSLKEFITRNNRELLGIYGNLVNRTLVFIEKYYDYKMPKGKLLPEIKEKIKETYEISRAETEKANLKDALCNIMNLARFANKYFDTNKPWEERTTNPESCENTIFNCVQIIANLAVLLEPFLPFSSEKIFGWLQINKNREIKEICSGFSIPKSEILFERILEKK